MVEIEVGDGAANSIAEPSKDSYDVYVSKMEPEQVRPYERAYPEAVYLRGLAYLRLHKGPEAAAEFRKILDYKGASWVIRYRSWGLYYSFSSLGLAGASVLGGD
jgi:hypothetical protein